MASGLLVKRLLTQAGVSVLAGLLMSSAALAEDISGPADEAGVSAGETDGSAGEPEVSIDPVDPGDWGGDGEIGSEDPSRENNPDGEEGSNYRGDGEEGSDVDPGIDDGSDEGTVDFDAPDEGTVEDGEIDGPEVDVVTDPVCAACSGLPDPATDPAETPDVFHTMTDQVETRDLAGSGAGKDFGRDAAEIGAEHEGGLGSYYRRVVK